MVVDIETQANTFHKEISQQQTVTGGTVISFVYKDGVMISTDTRASHGKLKLFDDIKRVSKCGDYTLLAGGGELSDYKYVCEQMDKYILEDWSYEDQTTMDPSEILAVATRIFYYKRTRMDPLMASMIVGGYKNNTPYLGYVDQFGTNYQDDYICTGLGRYFGNTLIHKYHNKNMNEDEARNLMKKVWTVLYSRDTTSSNNIQFATATKDGLNIEEPIKISTYWNLSMWKYPKTDPNSGIL